MNDWCITGEKGWDIAEQDAKDRQQRYEENKKIKYRFRIPPNSEATVLWLDNLWYFLYEHSVRLNGYFSRMTCIQSKEDCPECLRGGRRIFGVASTIIRLTPYVTRKGEQRNYMKCPVVFSGKALENIKTQHQNMDKNMIGLVYRFRRGSDSKSCATGEDFTPIMQNGSVIRITDFEQLRKHCPQDERFEDWIKPFDYTEQFPFYPADVMRRKLGIPDPMGAAQPHGTESTDLNSIFGTNAVSVAPTPDSGAPANIDDLFAGGGSQQTETVPPDDDIPF